VGKFPGVHRREREGKGWGEANLCWGRGASKLTAAVLARAGGRIRESYYKKKLYVEGLTSNLERRETGRLEKRILRKKVGRRKGKRSKGGKCKTAGPFFLQEELLQGR